MGECNVIKVLLPFKGETENRTWYIQHNWNQNNDKLTLSIWNGTDVWASEVSPEQICPRSTNIEDLKKFMANKEEFRECLKFTSTAIDTELTAKLEMPDSLKGFKVFISSGEFTLKKVENPIDSAFDILDSILELNRDLMRESAEIKQQNDNISKVSDECLKHCEKMTADKNELEGKLYTKFYTILNRKKDRITELQKELQNCQSATATTANGATQSASTQETVIESSQSSEEAKPKSRGRKRLKSNEKNSDPKGKREKRHSTDQDDNDNDDYDFIDALL